MYIMYNVGWPFLWMMHDITYNEMMGPPSTAPSHTHTHNRAHIQSHMFTQTHTFTRSQNISHKMVLFTITSQQYLKKKKKVFATSLHYR